MKFAHQPAVSNCHAVIEADEDGATIYDISANGTKLKGKRLKANIMYHLEHESSLLFGNVEALWLQGAPVSKVDDSDGEMSDNLLEDEEENRCLCKSKLTMCGHQHLYCVNVLALDSSAKAAELHP